MLALFHCELEGGCSTKHYSMHWFLGLWPSFNLGMIFWCVWVSKVYMCWVVQWRKAYLCVSLKAKRLALLHLLHRTDLHTEDSLPLVSLSVWEYSVTSFHFNQPSLFQMFSSICPPHPSSINNQSQLMLHLQKALIFMYLSGWRVSINVIHCVSSAALGQQLHGTLDQCWDHSNELRLYGYMYGSPSCIPPLFLGLQLTTHTLQAESSFSGTHQHPLLIHFSLLCSLYQLTCSAVSTARRRSVVKWQEIKQ